MPPNLKTANYWKRNATKKSLKIRIFRKKRNNKHLKFKIVIIIPRIKKIPKIRKFTELSTNLLVAHGPRFSHPRTSTLENIMRRKSSLTLLYNEGENNNNNNNNNNKKNNSNKKI